MVGEISVDDRQGLVLGIEYVDWIEFLKAKEASGWRSSHWLIQKVVS
jgi:hypothetical protein